MKLGGVIFILSFWIAGLVAPTYLTLTSGDTIPRAIEKHEKEQNESEEKDSFEVDVIVPCPIFVKLDSFRDINGSMDKGRIDFRGFSKEIILPPPEHLH